MYSIFWRNIRSMPDIELRCFIARGYRPVLCGRQSQEDDLILLCGVG